MFGLSKTETVNQKPGANGNGKQKKKGGEPKSGKKEEKDPMSSK